MIFRNVLCGLFVALMMVPITATSEDIDLFLGLPSGSSGAPNVLFILDNTGNWTAPFEAEKAALQAAFDAFERLEDGKINVGLMMFTETGGDDKGPDGGYIRAAIRPMDGNVPGLYSDLIGGFHERDDKSNSGKAGLTMAEAYLYFAGESPLAGNQKAKTDYRNVNSSTNEYFNKNNASQATCCVESHPVWKLPENALLAGKNSTAYNSPIADASCAKNYIIWVSNGPAQDSQNDSKSAKDLLADQTKADGTLADTTQINLSPSGSSDNYADEWARFMYESEEQITTFTIDVNASDTGQGPGWTRLLKSMADESNGDFFDAANDPNAIADAVAAATTRILAENSVFASVALPVASGESQSTFINQVYIGVFRPDADANPRWQGNLKQYKFGLDGTTLRVVDADNDPIIDGTGFVTQCARSFWTPTAVDSYWSFLGDDAEGICEEVVNPNNPAYSNSPDGPIVEKGGQAYTLRANDKTRTIYTCDPNSAAKPEVSCSVRQKFDTNNPKLTPSSLGAADQDEADSLIQWGMGLDTDDEKDPNSPGPNIGSIRPSVHGDVIHSRPVAFDYNGDPNNPDTVVFYGANDGLLRAINGNREDLVTPNIAGYKPGYEFWSFMPSEFIPNIKRLRDNTTKVNFPASGPFAGTLGEPKVYGADGALTLFSGDIPRESLTNKKYLYMGMRRAARTVYAFDVTDKTDPKILWKKGCPNLDPNDPANCSTDWGEIGQTWSPLSVAYADGYNSGDPNDPNPILIMGGGYDVCEDFDDGSTRNNMCDVWGTKGNGVYVLDAYTGNVLTRLPTDRAVPGGVTLVTESEIDSSLKYVYLADTGGNVYRVSGDAKASVFPEVDPVAQPIGLDPPSDWIITKVAALGCGETTDTSCTTNRKFLFPPDVIRLDESNDTYYLLIGSGDREKPLLDYGGAAAVENHYFAIIDDPINTTWYTDNPNPNFCGMGATSLCEKSLTTIDPNTPVGEGTSVGPKGWKFALRDNEQVVSGSLTISNVVNFSTHIPVNPNETTCESNLGTATTYNIGYDTGKGDLININGGGLVPTPVAGEVILDNGDKYPFCIGCGDENSAIGGGEQDVEADWSQPKARVYWKIDK